MNPRPPLRVQASGFFVLRTPLLPVEAFEATSAKLLAPAAWREEENLDALLEQDRAQAISALRARLADPIVREALFLASPSVHDALAAWMDDPASSRGHGALEVLLRYLTRMSTRPTPFGLFSGCSLGTLGAKTRLELGAKDSSRRHTRLDVHYLSGLCEGLRADPTLRPRLRLRPSSALHRTKHQLRYAEGREDPKTRTRAYALVSIERSRHVDAALECAAAGASLDEIARAIVACDPEVPLEDAREFVESMVESQILSSDLDPVVTGPEPIDDLVERLQSYGASAAEPLRSARDALRDLDAGGPGQPAARYLGIAESLSGLPAEVDVARLFQVDLYKPAPECSLGPSVARELARAVECAARIRPHAPDAALALFRERFGARYEGREVPLLDALDEDTGIGFPGAGAVASEPSPLLEGLRFPGDPASPTTPFGPRERWLLRRAFEASRANAREWALDEEDVRQLSQPAERPFPDAFAVMATLAASEADAVDRGDFRLLLHGIPGPSGAVLLGRFCHGDPDLGARVRDHLRAEEALRPGAIFAEIVHLPEGRLGNLFCRPLLREHEIAFLGRGGAPEDKRIDVADLRVSVRGGRVFLRSARLDREIIPRLTAAHNWRLAAIGVYRFLAALQSQDGGGLAWGVWSWGPAVEAPFLPRVVYGKVVLSLAQWSVRDRELTPAAPLGPSARYRHVQRLREARGWPRCVALADGDNVLPLDLDNTLHVDLLVAAAKKRPEMILTEVFPGRDDLVARGPEGRFTHEMVVPFVRVRDDAAPRAPAPRPPSRPLARQFAPGSSWLFASLYVGSSGTDAALRDLVAPLVAEVRSGGTIDRWFFIRYNVPDWHLRVRLHGDPERLTRDILPRLHALAAPWLEDGRIWKLDLETYEREVERYGGEAGIELCEAIFHADSDAVLRVLPLLAPGTDGLDARWRLAVRGVRTLLEDLGLQADARARVLRRMRDYYAAEHHADGALEADLGARFRAERPALEELLGARLGSEHPLEPGFAPFAERSRRIAPLAEEMRSRDLPIERIAESLLHMHVNRLLRSEHRAQELVLCDFLARLDESAVARGKRGRG